MPRCPQCASQIDPRAKVCPWCRQRLGFRTDRLAGVIIALGLVAGCAIIGSRKNHDSETLYRACLAKTVHCSTEIN